uniref:Uncharacterized protein n=1 Tax=Klebsiella phage FKP3 TaxID=3231233 RepID=A0AAU8HZ83_9CAUD
MFHFMLTNTVTLRPNEGWWTRYDSNGNAVERYHCKYSVSVNDTAMFGMDLERAIQYYHDN